jgi:hypothetical protein
MRARRRKAFVTAVAAAAVAVLATQAGAKSDGVSSRPAATPVGRTVELMEALKTHRYEAACDVYDPVFWAMVGFASRDCAAVLRKTFPSTEPVAYRVEFGGRIGPRMAVVIVSMALGDAALTCAEVWRGTRHCPSAGTYYLELTLSALPVDWRGRKVPAPQTRWYVASVGDV